MGSMSWIWLKSYKTLDSSILEPSNPRTLEPFFFLICSQPVYKLAQCNNSARSTAKYSTNAALADTVIYVPQAWRTARQDAALHHRHHHLP